MVPIQKRVSIHGTRYDIKYGLDDIIEVFNLCELPANDGVLTIGIGKSGLKPQNKQAIVSFIVVLGNE